MTRTREAIEAIRAVAQTGYGQLPGWTLAKLHRERALEDEDAPWLEYLEGGCTRTLAEKIAWHRVERLRAAPRLELARVRLVLKADADEAHVSDFLIPLKGELFSGPTRLARAQRRLAAQADLVPESLDPDVFVSLIIVWERRVRALVARSASHPGWPCADRHTAVNWALVDKLSDEIGARHPWWKSSLRPPLEPLTLTSERGPARVYRWIDGALCAHPTVGLGVMDTHEPELAKWVCQGAHQAGVAELLRMVVALQLALPPDRGWIGTVHKIAARFKAVRERAQRDGGVLDPWSYDLDLVGLRGVRPAGRPHLRMGAPQVVPMGG